MGCGSNTVAGKEPHRSFLREVRRVQRCDWSAHPRDPHRRVSTPDGADWRAEGYADALNDAVAEGRWGDIAALRDIFFSPVGPQERYTIPATAEWGSPLCTFRSPEMSEGECGPAPLILEVRSNGDIARALADDSYRDSIRVNKCSSAFESLLGVAVTFLLDNQDIIRWATCLLYGPAYEERIVNKLQQSWFADARLDITCDDGDDQHGAVRPCIVTDCTQEERDRNGGACDSYLALSWALVGINICTTTGKVEKWLELYASTREDGRLCALIDVSQLLVHELAHVALTFRSGDLSATQSDELDGACARSHLLESIYSWAIYQRYPQALGAECCADIFGTSPSANQASQFMNPDPNSATVYCEVIG